MGFNGSFSGGGGGGTPGPQGPTGPEGPEGPQGPAGSGTTLDWMGVDATTSFVLADWQDAGDLGGATTVKRGLLDTDRGVAMRPNLDSSGSPATGARAQGMLLSVAPGDFCHGFRVSVQTSSKMLGATLGDTIDVGAAYVDGTDVSTASWYGLIFEYLAAGAWPQTPNWFKMQGTSGGNKWSTFSSYTFVGAQWANAVEQDIWLVRSGTTLTAYTGAPGGTPIGACTWTVGTGAGLVGVRFEMYSAVADNAYRICVLAHSGSVAASPPWEV